MNIDFCGPAVSISGGGISYRLKVDGQKVACLISQEVLQDIDPSSYEGDLMSQFKSHKSTILALIEKKIRGSEIIENKVYILTADLET